MANAYTNPGGTGNRTASITVTTTATAGGGNVTQIVDGTQTNSFWWTASQSGREIKFDFGIPRKIIEAKWYQDLAATHGDWKWQGSSDGSTWTDIGTTFTLGATLQTQTTLAANTNFWRYYRLLQMTGVTSQSNYTREIEFNIDDTVVLVTNAIFSQAGSEAWINNLPQARFSQLGVEAWRTVDLANLTTQAAFSQIGLEAWISRPQVNTPANFSQVGIEVWRSIELEQAQVRAMVMA